MVDLGSGLKTGRNRDLNDGHSYLAYLAGTKNGKREYMFEILVTGKNSLIQKDTASVLTTGLNI